MNSQTIRRIVSYIAPYRLLLAGAFAGALLSIPFALLGPVLIGRGIDTIVGSGNVDFKTLAGILAVFAFTFVFSALMQWVMAFCARKLSAVVAQDMRRQAFKQINQVPLAKLDTHSRGDLVSRLVNDADALAEGLLQAISQLLPGFVTILSTIGVMLSLSVPIALVVILVTPLSILFARFVGRRTAAMFRLQSKIQGQMSGHINEMVRGQALVSAFGFEERSAEEFSEISDEYYKANYKATLYSSIINPGTRLVNAIVYAAVGTLGGVYAITGGITIGGLSAFLSFANQYTKPFNEITAVLTQMQGAVASAERLFQVIDWAPEKPDSKDALTPINSDGQVVAKEVSFSYHKNRPFIEGLNLEAKSGQRIALVGPTGCGKTTLINLLMRFYELDGGEIQIDGTNTTLMKRDFLRSLFGMVLQDTWLKKASVRDNIAYGCPNAGEEEIVQAAKSARAHSFIKRLPQGYDTIIQSGGENLSAGQKQLLCIARIMLSKPDILILDEATSSIDTRSEMLIQQALDKLMQGHTSFIVAHRLSTIQSADLILVMRDGQIIEQGKHQELLLNKGFYATLYNSQFSV